MHKLQELTLRMERSYFEDDIEVEFVPLHRSMNKLSCVAAIGKITTMKQTHTPPLCSLERLSTGETIVVVEVHATHGINLMFLEIKKNNVQMKVTLSDFSSLKFKVRLLCKMLRNTLQQSFICKLKLVAMSFRIRTIMP